MAPKAETFYAIAGGHTYDRDSRTLLTNVMNWNNGRSEAAERRHEIVKELLETLPESETHSCDTPLPR